MKIICTILFLAWFCFSISAQDGRFEFQDVCGNPMMESSLFIELNGKVVEIVDGDTIVIRSKEKRRTVNLITVDASSNDAEAKRFLRKRILKKNVLFTVNRNAAQVSADVFFKGISVNRSMITTGIARYKKTENYTFSVYKSCVYRQLEEIAKKDKLGIWAK